MPFAERAGRRIHYRVMGAGTPLLLLQHSGASSEGWPEIFLQTLAARRRLLAPDYRGTGLSEDSAEPYGMGDLAADMLAVLDAEHVGAADVLGVSMGGAVAQELTLMAPQRVRRLVLAATFCGPSHSAPPESWTMPLFSAPAGSTRDEAIRRFLPVYFSRTFIAANEAKLVQLIGRGSALNLASTPVRQGAANRDFDSHGRLPQIRVPTLILHGESDAITPLANAGILEDRIPDAKIVTLPGVGHVITTERPLETAALILDFLDRG